MNLRNAIALALLVLAAGTILRPSPVVADDPPDLGGRQFQWSNGFGFQGRLTMDGVPAEGSFNFQFLLFNDAVAGSQVKSTLSQTLTVTNGVFNTQLFFDDALESGSEYWVEVRVKRPADVGYTLLNPRQRLLAAPYA